MPQLGMTKTLLSFKECSFKAEKTRPSVLKWEKPLQGKKISEQKVRSETPPGMTTLRFHASSHLQILGSGLSHDITGVTHTLFLIAVIPHHSVFTIQLIRNIFITQHQSDIAKTHYSGESRAMHLNSSKEVYSKGLYGSVIIWCT